MKKQFFVQYDDGQLWLNKDDDTQDLFDWNAMDTIANGYYWTVATKEKKQRKYRPRSPITPKLVGMIPFVKDFLINNVGGSVRVFTPDIEVIFEC